MTASTTHPTALAVGQRLVELCRQGKNRQAIEELYADRCTVIEAMACETGGKILDKAEILKGSDHFFKANDVHGFTVEGPYPCGDRFICTMSTDLTPREGPMAGRRFQMTEACHYTVKDGKINRSEFFYEHSA